MNIISFKFPNDHHPAKKTKILPRLKKKRKRKTQSINNTHREKKERMSGGLGTEASRAMRTEGLRAGSFAGANGTKATFCSIRVRKEQENSRSNIFARIFLLG